MNVIESCLSYLTRRRRVLVYINMAQLGLNCSNILSVNTTGESHIYSRFNISLLLTLYLLHSIHIPGVVHVNDVSFDLPFTVIGIENY